MWKDTGLLSLFASAEKRVIKHKAAEKRGKKREIKNGGRSPKSAKAKMFYVFAKDGFTKGSKEDFVAFLQTKGIKIK